MQTPRPIDIHLYERQDLLECLPHWHQFAARLGHAAPSHHPIWLSILAQGLKQRPYALEAVREGRTVGLLPLMFVQSALFGRFLVGLPYLNSGGVVAQDAEVATALVDQAVALADSLDVRHLELRHEKALAHPAFNFELTTKVHMRLALPDSTEALWNGFDPKVRNQIRKAEKHELSVQWGGLDLLDDFYAVFSHNMRDLGTPVFGRALFQTMILQFCGDAEFCIVRQGARAIGGAVLIHGGGVSEVPSASTLRRFNTTNANMLMYWHLLQRAVARRQEKFDFGRSSEGSGTYRFKQQWGARPEPAVWQYYVRQGAVAAMRPDSPRNQRLIQIWKRLPVPVANWFGPHIIRGIP